MTHWPNVVAALDDDTVAVAFQSTSSPEVWDLAEGKLVRTLDPDCEGRASRSIVGLPGGRIAVGWKVDETDVVTVFEAATGRQLQELRGYEGYILSQAFVAEHLLVLSEDKTLRVLSEDDAEQVRHESERASAAPREEEWMAGLGVLCLRVYCAGL